MAHPMEARSMKDANALANRRVRTWSLVVLGAIAVLPVAVACQPPENNPPPNVAGAGSAGYPGYPPGYGQPGYPAAGQTAYPPGTYPPPGQTAYPPATTTYPGTAPTYPAPGTMPPGQPQPAPSGSAAPTLAPSDPNSLQGILQGIQNAMQGQTVPGGGGGGGAGGLDLTDVGLKAQAMRLAPGMQAEGDELKQSLQQGQHAVMMVTLQAGKCYTLIGFSAPGAVADLDLNLLAPPLYMTLAGQDLTHNNMPVIGAHPSEMCPVIAFPLQYKLDVVANKGSGVVAVQLFSKNK
jgi:hypothetical protein